MGEFAWPRVVLEQIEKIYPNGVHAIRGLDLHVDDGEFLVLVGPSGCGKSTALRMIAGLEDITAGTMRIGDRVVNDVEPKHRDIAMVFQNYALYPHMSVAKMFAMSVVALVPLFIAFLIGQRFLIRGIATTGLK